MKALKAGTRKNGIMSAMHAQLSPDEMANVAAYFAWLPGANAGARSDFLPTIAMTSVAFPEGYPSTYVKYRTINFPETRQARYYFANPGAVEAARAGWGRDIPEMLRNEDWNCAVFTTARQQRPGGRAEILRARGPQVA